MPQTMEEHLDELDSDCSDNEVLSVSSFEDDQVFSEFLYYLYKISIFPHLVHGRILYHQFPKLQLDTAYFPIPVFIICRIFV